MATDWGHCQNNACNVVGKALLLGMAFLSPCSTGCGGKQDGIQQSVTGIDKRVIGKWKVLDGNFRGTIIEFTSGGMAVANTQHKWMPGESRTGKYSTSGNTIKITESNWMSEGVTYEVDYSLGSSVVAVLKKDSLSGFSGFDGHWERIGLPSTEANSSGGMDFSGLRGVLTGKWQKVEEATAYSKPDLLDFTDKSVEETNSGGFKHVGKYVLKDDLITFTDRNRHMNVYGLEFVSDGEIALRPEAVTNGSNFNDLSGRWKRISLPPNRTASTQDSGPVATAKKQVLKIEVKLAKLEAIQKAALADRDDLAAKLRSVGVNAAADLKGNIRGQRIAENIAKLATEIGGRERQLMVIDGEILKAKSLVRRMEQEQVELSEDEMRNLALHLREAEERTDGPSLPITPIDVDAAVENALKSTPGPKKSK